MSNVRFTLAELIRSAIDSRLLDAFTCCAGIVHAYNATKMCADIQLVSKRPIETEDREVVFEEIAILPEVRVQFPRAGNSYIVFPLSPGDGGMVHFNMFDISGWLTTGNVLDPSFTDSHLIQSAVFVPGLAPDLQVLPAAAESAMSIVADDVRLGDYQAGNIGELALHENLITLAEAIGGAVNGDAIPAAVNAVLSDLLGSTVKGKKAT